MVTVDVFPADLWGPTGKHRGMRVLVADGRLLVFSRDGGVHLEAQAQIAGTQQQGANRRARYIVTDTDGGVWTFSQNGACPCGSPFKRVSAQQLLAMVEA